MHWKLATLLGLVLATLAGCTKTMTRPQLNATNLRTEYHANPIGIDETRPRFSWVPMAASNDAQNLRQSAYRVLVARSEEKLSQGSGDLWDSGKVKSDATAQVEYAGEPLPSNTRAFWKVKVWDQDGGESAWSDVGHWSTGLLNESDWRAKWIGYDAPLPQGDEATTRPAKELTLDGLKWIWADEGDPKKKAPKESRYFAHRFKLDRSDAIKGANFIGTADDKFALLVNGRKAGEGTGHKQSFTIDVAQYVKAGEENLLAIEATNTSESPAGLVGRLVVEFHSGQPLVVNIDKSWKWAKDKPADWEKATLDITSWKVSRELVTVGEEPWGKPGSQSLTLPPAKYVRKAFEIPRAVTRATVYASALGLYELRLNGQRVGENYFTPGWTDYRKRVYYNTYDVTPMVKSGKNALAAIVADGWYSGYVGYAGRRAIWGVHPRLLVQLHLQFSDGSEEIVATDESWKASHGPVREADLLHGCVYDARKEMKGWESADFDDSRWQSVVIGDKGAAKLQAYPGSPVTKHEQLAAKSVKKIAPNVHVFDLGQNMVGWVRLKTKAPAGTKITLRHSEMLNADGTLYTTALRSARATDVYLAKGADDETFEPAFTFHGFQYVEVSGLADPKLDAVTGIVLHADLQQTGSFECSNPLVNQLFHNIIWGQKGNYFEAPTDCPQRDERLGWTGDAQFFVRTGTYNMDVAAFFTKWTRDLEDGQKETGEYPDVAPVTPCATGAGNTAWGDAGVICPYTMYKYYGDKRLIERHYPSMVKYLDHLEKTAKDHIRGQGAYGDWLNLGGGASSEVIGTAYYQYVTQLMAEMSEVLGKNKEAAKYAKGAKEIRDAFINKFVLPDGGIKDSSQTGFALAFTMDLLPDDIRANASAKFVGEIAKTNWHLGTGFIGTPRLLPALTRAGRSDVAYRLLLTDTFPSWLYPVTLGATTMWERWDGWRPDAGFQDPGMNSFNHYAFGSVGEWMYATAAGIENGGEAFKKVVIRPHVGGGLTFVKARYNSMRGEIASSWSIDKGLLAMHVTVPPNTTATVYVPARGRDKVKTHAGDFVRMDGDAAVYEVGSGTHKFASEQ